MRAIVMNYEVTIVTIFLYIDAVIIDKKNCLLVFYFLPLVAI